MKHTKSRALFAFVCPFLLLFSSCLGVNLDITLNQNGSGIVVLEYRVSRAVDSLGKLDGNERWNTIPVGRSDFERTLDRLPEMKLISFSSKEDEKDLLFSAKMEFSSVSGLLAFLDASGRRSSFSGDALQGRLHLVLNEGAETNTSLSKLVADISESYAVRMSMTFPGEGSLALSDSGGKNIAAVPGGEIRARGKNVFCRIPLREVLASTEGISVDFNWQGAR